MSFLKALKNTMSRPTWFGWYHILWLCIVIAACVLIYIFRQKISKKGVDYTLLAAGIVLIVLESLKQMERSLSIGDGGTIHWHYPPADFPFQFCSTPMYLFLLCAIMRKGRVYDAMMSYLATFGFFGGLIVLAYPMGVYVESAFINVHTMIWHSSMVVMGFLILATRSVKLHLMTVVKGIIVFTIFVVMAILMNVFAHLIVPNEYFNMFYIGPYYPNNFVVLQDIYQSVPWAVFVLIYIIGFSAASLIVMLLAIAFDKLEVKIHSRKKEKQG